MTPRYSFLSYVTQSRLEIEMADQTADVADAARADGPMLTPLETRVLGVLMEKRRTTPDNYPLTLNALVQGCNQKTSRNPVMKLGHGEVGHTVNLLRDRALIHASFFGGRAERYEHKLAGALELDQREQAVMCVLMLRGPQTLGELRTNASRLAEFADLAAMNQVLELLMARVPPLVMRIARAPGRREERFAHLLCGKDGLEQPAEAVTAGTESEEPRIAELEREVVRLRAELEALWRLTGLEDRRPGKEYQE
jgi:uncharacterized protein YceH (UPF0502 family)